VLIKKNIYHAPGHIPLVRFSLCFLPDLDALCDSVANSLLQVLRWPTGAIAGKLITYYLQLKTLHTGKL
jgi:hypothetical protein